jgi:hypothetical protein
MRPANDNMRVRNWQFAGLSAGQTIFATIAAAIAVSAIVAGLLVIDPPWVARLVQLDNQCSSRLSSLNFSIGRYYKDHGKLPASLSEAAEPQKADVLLADCTAGSLPSVEYQPGKERDFKLCATFRLASRPDTSTQIFWTHPAGRQCFDLIASSP